MPHKKIVLLCEYRITVIKKSATVFGNVTLKFLESKFSLKQYV